MLEELDNKCKVKAQPTEGMQQKGNLRGEHRYGLGAPSLRVNGTNPLAMFIRERGPWVFHTWRSSVVAGGGRDWHGDEKVVGENIGIQVSERGRTPQLGGGNPSIRFIPFPVGLGKAV
jgi:hypothetical protein